jgi:nitroreductase
MEYYHLIKTRESIREYDSSRPVERDRLMRILDAGRLAPSASNRQPWRFLVVSSERMLKKVRACYQRDWFGRAPHILVVAGRRSDAWVRQYDGYNSLETDLTIAMDHMILAAENEGIGACWIAAFDPEILRDALTLNSDETVFAITPLGYPPRGFSKKGHKDRKPLQNIVSFL